MERYNGLKKEAGEGVFPCFIAAQGRNKKPFSIASKRAKQEQDILIH